jgi:hypothetical protein
MGLSRYPLYTVCRSTYTGYTVQAVQLRERTKRTPIPPPTHTHSQANNALTYDSHSPREHEYYYVCAPLAG